MRGFRKGRPGRAVGAMLVLVGVVIGGGTARAQIGSDRYSSIVVEASSGTVLSAANADEMRYPASLTKMMTLYMTFEALRDRRIGLNDLVPVSANAASMQPSKLGLVPGSRFTVEQGILALVTKSANDAAAALGEMLGGDEDRFAQMMTLRAHAIGMTRTVFRNASGLPDYNQVTTARDLAVLARRIILDFPGFYGYFSTPSFAFRGRTIFNHDRMLISYPGADGLKTGYIGASGFNLVTSAVHSNVRLIGVVMGASSSGERDIHMTSLLDQGFDRMDVPPEGRRVMQASSRIIPSIVPVAQAATMTYAAASRQVARLIEPPQRGAKPVVQQVAASAGGARWSVQVGTFATEKAARDAAAAARRTAEGGSARVEQISVRGKTQWRAQVAGLTQEDAQDACADISRKRIACFVIRPGQGQLASR